MQTPLGNDTAGNHLFTLDINRQTSQPALFSFFSVGTDVFWELIKEASALYYLIPSNAEATHAQNTRTQRYLKTI